MSIPSSDGVFSTTGLPNVFNNDTDNLTTGGSALLAGDDRLTVNQDQFGDNNGIRVSCYLTATSTSNIITYEPVQSRVLVSTNVALPVTNWADLGPATPLGGGYCLFIDTNAIGQPRRYYLLRKQ